MKYYIIVSRLKDTRIVPRPSVIFRQTWFDEDNTMWSGWGSLLSRYTAKFLTRDAAESMLKFLQDNWKEQSHNYDDWDIQVEERSW